MRKYILLVTALLSVSCVKDEIAIEPEMSDGLECYGNVACLGVYNVEIVYSHDDVPEGLIIAEDGYSAELGDPLSFRGTSAPGFKFIGWRKVRNSYCAYSPIVDQDDPTLAYVYMHEKYMGNCNLGPFNVKIVAEFIKTLD